MANAQASTPEASSSVSPTEPHQSNGLKRPRASETPTASKELKKIKSDKEGGKVEETATKAVYCHQCRRKADKYLRCTEITCNKAYCESDLRRRYNTNLSDFIDSSNGRDAAYDWTCPHCRDVCQTDTCRRKSGLEPIGRLPAVKPAVNGSMHGEENGDITDKIAANGKSETKTKKAKKDDTMPGPDTTDAPKAQKAKKPRASAPAASASKASGDKDKTAESSKSKAVIKASRSSPSLSPAPEVPDGPKPHDPKKKQRPSHVFSFSSDSSLTDTNDDTLGSSSKSKQSVKKATKKPIKKVDAKIKATAGTKQVNGRDKVAGKAKEKATGKSTGKEKAKSGKEGEKKPRAKPVKKPEVPVEPPVFEKVDTRLGRIDAEHRIMLREYLCRFRAVLSIPERSLPALDDFDRPPTDASVRLFAGAMLDLIKEDLEGGNADEDVIEVVDKYREELRYYADLARFANAYKQLEEPLGLNLPKNKLPATSGAANATAVRELLGLADDDELPPGFGGGPARRTAASRLPQPHEVIRMLLALAERTLSTPAIRADLVWEAPENEARRQHAKEIKAEMENWAKIKKNLMAAALHCKTAAATKANKEKTAKETKDHEMRLAPANVNLRAAISSRAQRHEPLGIDLDGRVYYCLSQRPIDDDSRPPVGWASGLLVWGVGVPPKSDAPIDEDDLPLMVERWCHFGQSTDVRQLVKWIEYRTRKAVEEGRKTKTPAKAKANGTPNGKATPKASTPKGATPTPAVNKQLTLDFGQASSPVKSSPLKRKTLEVVIPVSKASRASSEDGMSDVSSESELSDLSDDDDLLQYLAPEGYKPSVELIEENGKELARKLAEVAEWLEVLESKGMGEVVK